MKTTTYSSTASRAGVLRCFTSLAKALTSPWCPHGATGIFLQIHGFYRASVSLLLFIVTRLRTPGCFFMASNDHIAEGVQLELLQMCSTSQLMRPIKGCEIAFPTAEAVFCAAFTGVMQTKNKSCFLAGKLHLWIIILTNIGGKGLYWLILPDVFQNLCGCVASED